MAASEVFVFCDGGRHPGRVAPVTTFVRRSTGDWYEKIPRHDRTSTLFDGRRWRLSCDVCGNSGTVLAVRRETLIPALEKLADNGVPHISLPLLAASV